eukprot:6191864-Pleurochrysis_carterae.AAC.1
MGQEEKKRGCRAERVQSSEGRHGEGQCYAMSGCSSFLRRARLKSRRIAVGRAHNFLVAYGSLGSNVWRTSQFASPLPSALNAPKQRTKELVMSVERA